MDYEVHIVDDSQLAADWVLLSRAGVFVLLLRRAFDVPAVHARARALIGSHAA